MRKTVSRGNTAHIRRCKANVLHLDGAWPVCRVLQTRGPMPRPGKVLQRWMHIGPHLPGRPNFSPKILAEALEIVQGEAKCRRSFTKTKRKTEKKPTENELDLLMISNICIYMRFYISYFVNIKGEWIHGDPGVKIQCFDCRGLKFDPCSGNEDPTCYATQGVAPSKHWLRMRGKSQWMFSPWKEKNKSIWRRKSTLLGLREFPY